MVKHLFKLIWNQKKQNFLLITEIFVSFMVIFAVFTLLVYFYRNFKQPLGLEYQPVWAIRFDPPETIHSKDSLVDFYESIGNILHSVPEIQSASFTSGNYPFSPSTNNNLVTYGKTNVMSNFYVSQEEYGKVLGLVMKEGRWFNAGDRARKNQAVVINESLKRSLFRDQVAVGKKLGEGPEVMEIVGVVNDFKDKGDFQPIKNGIFKPLDSNNLHLVATIIVKVSPVAGAGFEGKLFKMLSNAIGSSIEIRHLASQRVAMNMQIFVPLIILFSISGFLVINVALGLFGVLWYNINKRKAEIGLRRAVGASGSSITRQFVGEALAISTLAILLGCFFALQFPILGVFDLEAGIYLAAIGFAILFVYALVILCAFYPGKQAAGIYPATALHED